MQKHGKGKNGDVRYRRPQPAIDEPVVKKRASSAPKPRRRSNTKPPVDEPSHAGAGTEATAPTSYFVSTVTDLKGDDDVPSPRACIKLATDRTVPPKRKTVYMCGVWDVPHYGHFRTLEKASKFGDVIVGVHSDDDVREYKREPVMTMAERADTMRHIRYVTHVITDAPLSTSMEFMKKHGIDVVVIPEEYNNKRDIMEYYAEPHAAGAFVVVPRTEGISTSDLIERIHKAKAEKVEKVEKVEKKTKK